MAIITGTTDDDTLIVNTDTTSVQANAGTDIAVFSGNYADYTVSQSDSYVPLMTHNTTGQVVSLFGVERLQFDDGLFSLSTTDSGEFQVNTYTSSHQYRHNITALADGGFVITWESKGQDGSYYGIYAQRYDASGNTVGTEFQVNTYTTYSQSDPSITALADGGFVITWESEYQDGSSYGIYAQRYDVNGNTQGSEFQVNTYTSDSQSRPSITALTDGGFVVTWHGYGATDDSGYGIFAQRYDASGNTVGSEFRVNTYTTNHQASPSTTALTDGGFVVTWSSDGQDGSVSGIYAQRYDASGNNIGTEFQVNTYTSSEQFGQIITALVDGGFVIAWQSSSQDVGDGQYGTGIYAQRYDENGNMAGSEFQVNTYTSDSQWRLSTTALADGGFVITWSSDGQDGSDWGIYAQRYDASGNNVGTEFQVNTYTSNSQFWPSIVALNDDGFVITWSSDGQDGSDWGIYAQRYDADGNPLSITTLNEVTDNTPPTLTDFTMSDHTTMATVDEGIYYEHATSLHFTDADGDNLTYSATLADGSTLPGWLSIDAITGVLSGTPLEADAGAIDVMVTATDSGGLSVSDSYVLTVNNANNAPVAATSPQITMNTSLGAIVFELNAELAPITVENILNYVNSGFYDDTLMVKSPTNDSIILESDNGLSNLRGSIAMARTSTPDSATSQFFINLVDNSFLDYQSVSNPGYAVFGEVISGLSVIDSIAQVSTTTVGGYQNVPLTDVVITSFQQTSLGRINDTSTNEDAAYSYDASAHFTDVDAGDTYNFKPTKLVKY